MNDPTNGLAEALEGRYTFQEVLAEGGMGSVHLARDEKHGRLVAIKTIRPEIVTDAVSARFEREIAITANLQHPLILPLLDSGRVGELLYYVMPYVEGESLEARLGRGKTLSAEQASKVGRDACEGLGYAHSLDLIHRDIKPGNLLLTRDHAMLADFGIGKVVTADTDGSGTDSGGVIGSLKYMAPEQFKGEASPQSDIFSLGATLFEAVTGRTWFDESRGTPNWTGIPTPLRRVLERALADAPSDRWETAATFGAALEDALPRPASGRSRAVRLASVVIALAAASLAWFFYDRYRTQWANEVALPELTRLTARGDLPEALALWREAEPYLETDTSRAVLPRIARPLTIETEPAGARVSISRVAGPATISERRIVATEEWIDLGASPVQIDLLELGAYRFRASAADRDTLEAIYPHRFVSSGGRNRWHAVLPTAGSTPSGMAPVGPKRLTANLLGLASDYDPTDAPPRDPQYHIGKREVTNRAYKAFVDAGGYSDESWWRSALEDEGVTWDSIAPLLVDATGRPGPATWEGGTYAEGADDVPVGGISWFEAVAFAEFSGAALPTVFHWQGAREERGFDMSGFGNYRGEGPLPVGETAFGPLGVRDLGGNVREWAWNRAGSLRWILGGGWSDPSYMYYQGAAAPALDRSALNGIRLVDYLDADPAAVDPFRAPIDLAVSQSGWAGEPVDDDVFRVLAGQYAYDAAPLAERQDSLRNDSPYWTREFVSYAAAYGGERIPAQVFVPKGVDGPYQTLVFFPGAASMRATSSARLDSEDMIDAVVKSGRAVIHPIYKDTYERHEGMGQQRGPTQSYVTRKTRWIQDVRRTFDYVATRSDLDAGSLAYWGLSWGAEHGPIVLAVDDRPRVAVLMDTGALFMPVQPAADESVFAPRVRIPVLMINGRYDFIFPVERSQRALFDLLGTPPDQKQHVIFDAGHVVANTHFDDVMNEVTAWLDATLGRVP